MKRFGKGIQGECLPGLHEGAAEGWGFSLKQGKGKMEGCNRRKGIGVHVPAPLASVSVCHKLVWHSEWMKGPEKWQPQPRCQHRCSPKAGLAFRVHRRVTNTRSLTVQMFTKSFPNVESR